MQCTVKRTGSPVDQVLFNRRCRACRCSADSLLLTGLYQLMIQAGSFRKGDEAIWYVVGRRAGNALRRTGEVGQGRYEDGVGTNAIA